MTYSEIIEALGGPKSSGAEKLHNVLVEYGEVPEGLQRAAAQTVSDWVTAPSPLIPYDVLTLNEYDLVTKAVGLEITTPIAEGRLMRKGRK